MKKYRKFKRGKTINPYIIFIVAIVGICAMSVGYAMSSDSLYINGRANAKYKEYTITYVLNRGTNPANAVTSYTVLDDIPLPVPTREGFLFLGWYEDDAFDSPQLTTTSELSGDVTLYAKWKSANYYFQEYRHDEPYVFDGTNYLDTGIALYSQENWQKDFEIGFTIESYNQSINVDQAVFVNNKVENATLKYPGIVVRKEAANLEITETINNGTKAAHTIRNPSYPMTIKVYRIDGEIYYSINNGSLIFLQDMSNFNKQFNLTAWFGAAEDDNGNPMRCLKGTLSNMYVKLEEYETRKYTVTFNANGGNVSEPSRRVKEHTAVGELPVPTYDRRNFQGWYKDSALTQPANANLVINEDITLYAKWSDQLNVLYNGTYYATVGQALNAVPTGNEYSTITICDDMGIDLTIPEGKSVILDLQNNIVSSINSRPILTNRGNLKIINGIFSSNAAQAIINNESTGVLEISGGELIATGTKQAVYNNGGDLTITGDAMLSSNSSSRACVQNLNDGTLTITGGTIVSYNQSAISNDSGTLVVGVKDGTIDTQSILIQGKNYGIASSVNYSLYDGTMIAQVNAAVNNVNKITDKEVNSTIYTTTNVVDGVTYKYLYLVPSGE